MLAATQPGPGVPKLVPKALRGRHRAQRSPAGASGKAVIRGSASSGLKRFQLQVPAWPSQAHSKGSPGLRNRQPLAGEKTRGGRRLPATPRAPTLAHTEVSASPVKWAQGKQLPKEPCSGEQVTGKPAPASSSGHPHSTPASLGTQPPWPRTALTEGIQGSTTALQNPQGQQGGATPQRTNRAPPHRFGTLWAWPPGAPRSAPGHALGARAFPPSSGKHWVQQSRSH